MATVLWPVVNGPVIEVVQAALMFVLHVALIVIIAALYALGTLYRTTALVADVVTQAILVVALQAWREWQMLTRERA